MLRIRTYNSRELVAAHLDDRIIELDKENMSPILAAKGIPFSEEKRRKGLDTDATLHAACNGEGCVVGYLQYGPDWNHTDAIYISSVQIAPSVRGTSLFTRLVLTACEDLASRSFNRLLTNVQKHNKTAIELYRKLEFTIDEANTSEKSFPVTADRSVLDSERIGRLKRRI
jgi:ribosomal protein S18 acetylase RimI-like enzyme